MVRGREKRGAPTMVRGREEGGAPTIHFTDNLFIEKPKATILS